MDLRSLPQAHVQIIYLTISASVDLKDSTSRAGTIWHQGLDHVSKSEGYQRCHWGRSVENPDQVQLHIVRTSLAAHKAAANVFIDQVRPLLKDSSKPVVRHVSPMTTFTAMPTTAFDAPVTGTAFYIRITEAWHEGSWPCWTHIVRHVAGNSGISGGPLIETITNTDVLEGGVGGLKGGQNVDLGPCYLVYVGWESIKAHDDYHHTKHFMNHRVVLGIGNKGWREYGHIKFEGRRNKGTEAHTSKL